MSAKTETATGEGGDDSALILESYCTTTDQMFSAPSRDLIARYLPSFLDQMIITPTELLYSSKYQKKLTDAGRPLMNAVDRIATLQAKANKEGGSAKRVKDLHVLVSDLQKRVWEDEKNIPIPAFKQGEYTRAAAGLPAENREYFVCRMVTEHLFHHKTWKDKLRILVALHDETLGKPDNKFFGPMIAECLRSEPALMALFGPFDKLEERINDLIDLWKGIWEPRTEALPVTSRIAQGIVKGEFPDARAAIEVSLLRTLASKEQVHTTDVEGELQALARIIRRAWVDGGLIGGPKTLNLIEKRMGRYINNESLTDIMREPKAWVDKCLALMSLTNVAVGNTVRSTLLKFIDHYFGHEDFAKRLIAGNESPVYKLQGMTSLHKAIKASPLPEGHKNDYLMKIEAAEWGFLQFTKLFEQLDKKPGNSAQKVIQVLDLCVKGTFLEGRALEQAKAVLNAYLRQPDFLSNYLNGVSGPEADKKVEILVKTLGNFGLIYPPSMS